MQRGIALGLLAILFLLVVADDIADDDEDDEDFVLELTKENFELTLQKHNRILVKFYAPWCGHCKALAPEYRKASESMKTEEMNTRLAKVDVEKEKSLASKFDVTDYPTLIYFVDGKKSRRYDGEHEATAITRWLKTKETDLVKIMEEEGVKAWLDEVEEGEYALVARVKKGHSRKKAFFAAVEETLVDWDRASIRFGVVWLRSTADPKTDSSLSMWRPGWKDPDPELLNFSGVWSSKSVSWFAMNATYQTVGEKFSRLRYAPMSMNEMGWSAAVVAVIDDDASNEEIKEDGNEHALRPKVREVLLPLALENPEWKFVFADISKLEDHEFELLGTGRTSEPKILWLGENRKKYQLAGREQITDPSQVGKFIDNVKASKLKPFYKSAALPEHEFDEDGVRIITGDTFEETVKDPTKDVFVEFYAPWCQHCQKLEPEWAKLVKKGRRAGWYENKVVIAKFDASANECEEDVPSFPKLVLYPAVKSAKKMKARQVYSGKREAGALFDFVLETAKNLEDLDEDVGLNKQRRRKKTVETMMERELRAKRKAAEEL